MWGNNGHIITSPFKHQNNDSKKIMLFCQTLAIGRKMDFKFKYNFLGWFFVSAMPTGKVRSAFAQFSLFRLALFPFRLKASRAAALAVVFPSLRSFALQLRSRNFLFLSWVMWRAIHGYSDVYSCSNIDSCYITILKFCMDSRMSLVSPWARSYCRTRAANILESID